MAEHRRYCRRLLRFHMDRTERVAEIGVRRGSLYRYLMDSDNLIIKEYFLIDPWEWKYIEPAKPYERIGGYSQNRLDRQYRHVTRLIERYPNVKSRIMRMTSHDAAPMIADEYLDFVYIDGMHLYDWVHEDINLWLPKIREGGILAGDDYNIPGVKKAVKERFPDRYEIFHNQVWWVRV